MHTGDFTHRARTLFVTVLLLLVLGVLICVQLHPDVLVGKRFGSSDFPSVDTPVHGSVRVVSDKEFQEAFDRLVKKYNRENNQEIVMRPDQHQNRQQQNDGHQYNNNNNNQYAINVGREEEGRREDNNDDSTDTDNDENREYGNHKDRNKENKDENRPSSSKRLSSSSSSSSSSISSPSSSSSSSSSSISPSISSSLPRKPMMDTSGANTCFHSIKRDDMELWLRSDSIQVDNGGRISIWNDASGHNRHLLQPKVQYQPQFWQSSSANGWPIVRYDGSAILASAPWDMPTEEATVFMVGKYQVEASRSCLIGATNSGLSAYKLFGSTEGLSLDAQIQGWSAPMLHFPEDLSDYVITAVVFNGDNSVLRRNAANVTPLQPPNLNKFLSQGMIAVGGTIEDEIPIYLLVGNVLEVIMYSGHMSLDEIRTVESYLSDRYAIPLGITGMEQPDKYLGPPGPQLSVPDEAAIKSLSNNVLWIRAHDIKCEDRGRISVWNDISGHNHHLAQERRIYRPQYLRRSSANGWPSVKFSGAQYLTSSVPWVLSREESVMYVVGRFSSSTRSCIIGPATMGVKDEHYIVFSDSHGVGMVTDKHGVAAPDYKTNAQQSDFFLIAAIFDGQKSVLRVDGENEEPVVPDSKLLKFNADGMLSVGSCVSRNPERFLNGEVAEILIFDGLLTDAQRAIINRYLIKKYKL